MIRDICAICHVSELNVNGILFPSTVVATADQNSRVVISQRTHKGAAPLREARNREDRPDFGLRSHIKELYRAQVVIAIMTSNYVYLGPHHSTTGAPSCLVELRSFFQFFSAQRIPVYRIMVLSLHISVEQAFVFGASSYYVDSLIHKVYSRVLLALLLELLENSEFYFHLAEQVLDSRDCELLTRQVHVIAHPYCAVLADIDVRDSNLLILLQLYVALDYAVVGVAFQDEVSRWIQDVLGLT